MKKFYLLLLTFFFPLCVFSQFVIEPGYHVSYLVKPSTVNRTDSAGVWMVRGGFDINKNGKKEIIMLTDPNLSGGLTRDTSCALYLLENDGNDSYKLIWSYKLTYSVKMSAYRGYSDIAVADIDKDGNQEIWIVLPTVMDASRVNPPRLFAFEYDGTKLPDKPTAMWDLGIRDKIEFRPFNLVIEDVDNDGDVEILTMSRRDDYTGAGKGRTFIIGSMMTPLEPDGLNAFTQEFIDTSAYLKGGALYDMKVLDFDGDNKKEIWVFTWDKFTVNIYEPTSANVYPHVAELRQAIPIEYNQPQGDIGSMNGASFYDANGDGKLEGFVAGMAGEGVGEDGAVLYIKNVDDVSKLNKPTPGASEYVKMVGYRTGNPMGSCVGDFDKDGKMDFVFVDRKNDRLVKMEYKGAGDLADSTNYTWTTLLQDTNKTYLPDFPVATATPDMDGDGFPEILLANLDIKDPSRPMTIVLEATKVGSVNKLDNTLPEAYSLKQNYPNPFNPSTKIEFSVPKSSKVSLKIYDIVGKEVTTLISKDLEAGSYIATFDASKYSSGTYFYELRAGDYTSKMKMILMK